MFCPKCGRELPGDAFYCQHCGTSRGTMSEDQQLYTQEMVDDLLAAQKHQILVKDILIAVISILVLLASDILPL